MSAPSRDGADFFVACPARDCTVPRLPRETLLALAVVAGLAVPYAAVSLHILARMGLDRPYDVEYVPRGGALQLLSPSIRLSVADLYWLVTVQYIGEPRAARRGWDKLAPLGDLVTDLDPRHGYAYQTLGIMLSAAGKLDASDRILEKGMEPGHPGWWSYPFYVAFNNYFYRGDYAEAARWAEIAARTPGASPNISHLALALKVKSGDPDDAVRFLEEMRATVKDEKSAAAIDEQWRLAVLQRDFRRLDEAVERFRAARGRVPGRVEELVDAGALEAVPAEPFGGRYEIRADGKAHSTARDFRFRPAERSWRAPEFPRFPEAAPRRRANP